MIFSKTLTLTAFLIVAQNVQIANASERIVVMSDPQAWRLITGDPNSTNNKEPWEALNTKVVTSLNILSEESPISFSIINGDLTEFGREKTKESYDNIYGKLSFPRYIGLGNHDYVNNLGDCHDDGWNWGISANSCARYMVEYMVDKLSDYKKALSSQNFSADYDGTNLVNGSMAYSWDHGGFHFVQLQNYPTYTSTIGHWGFADKNIKSAMPWLESDLKAASERGKITILNMHDGSEHFLTASSSEEKLKLKTLINQYNIIATFVGHTHNAGQSNTNGSSEIFGNSIIYNSGALFKGDYLLVSLDDNCANVDLYNGSTGSPVYIRSFNKVCSG